MHTRSYIISNGLISQSKVKEKSKLLSLVHFSWADQPTFNKLPLTKLTSLLNWNVPYQSSYLFSCKELEDSKYILADLWILTGIHWDSLIPTEHIRYIQRLTEKHWDTLRLPETYWDPLRPIETHLYPLRPNETWDPLRPFETFRIQLRLILTYCFLQCILNSFLLIMTQMES